jgi:putative membrane protein
MKREKTMNSRAITTLAAAALIATGCVHLNRASDATAFRDPEVAMVLGVSNLVQVREGNVARDRASSKAVKDFASMMASEHALSASKTQNALAKKEIPSADSDLSRKIDADSGKTVASLRGLSGADFDRAYMDRTIAFHRSLIDTIDKTLKPAAKNKVVITAIDETRTAEQKHLEKAEEIRKGL